MSKNQRIVLLILVIGLVAYGLINNHHIGFECYILRTEDGMTYTQDTEPAFTDEDISGFDEKNMLIMFNAEMVNKMTNGAFDGEYPDRLIMLIEDEIVFDGYFETPLEMSYMPPGPYVRKFETSLQLEKGYGTLDVASVSGGSTNFKKIKDYFIRY